MNIQIPAEAVAAVESTRQRHREQIEAQCRQTAEALHAQRMMNRIVAALNRALKGITEVSEEFGLDVERDGDDAYSLIFKALLQVEADREALVEMVQAFTEDAPK